MVNSDMSILCPVCQNIMKQTGNIRLYYCNNGSIYFPIFNISLDMSHSSICLDSSGKQIFLRIISSEYRFDIYNVTSPKTVINRLTPVNNKSAIDFSPNNQFDFKELLVIDAAVNLPWNDHSKVKDAVKTYLTFS